MPGELLHLYRGPLGSSAAARGGVTGPARGASGLLCSPPGNRSHLLAAGGALAACIALGAHACCWSSTVEGGGRPQHSPTLLPVHGRCPDSLHPRFLGGSAFSSRRKAATARCAILGAGGRNGTPSTGLPPPTRGRQPRHLRAHYLRRPLVLSLGRSICPYTLFTPLQPLTLSSQNDIKSARAWRH